MRRKRFLQKLRNVRGETIGETLAALLVIVLAMTMLAGSIVSAAKVNHTVKQAETAFTTKDVSSTAESATVAHTGTKAGNSTKAVTAYTTNDDNAYVYYR